jgi:AraC-like DNA-binding protein
MSAPDLGSALQHFVRSQDYWGDGRRAGLRSDETGLTISYDLPSRDEEYGRQAAECAIAEIVVGAEMLVGQPVRPRAVRFRHARPNNTGTHERIFGFCPDFGADQNEVEFAPHTLGLSLKNASEDFFNIFAGKVEERIAHLDRSSSTANDVRVAARATLSRGGPSLSDIARILRTSPRTLQRRLQEEGTTFAEVIESLRQELAHGYLRERTPVTRVASLLGYADASAFCHAFRRWTGSSPGAHSESRSEALPGRLLE